MSTDHQLDCTVYSFVMKRDDIICPGENVRHPANIVRGIQCAAQLLEVRTVHVFPWLAPWL
ncbi:uncharacterized protein BO97DRAFT_271332 [Aspergillus homomorphus CBS 101889]|uniref:Uncharacterized protein n=1 Tax=Aspergillus homomorphus (strain CBS 101889) TaxID=1450537 RepID=A0A395I3G5_ASPHC|nr:hypothetical protein BO97DRAFT_271332 [Aspergillus homomorphus CBS 101889]RAL14497.1 hypothetical protein BO97DRAFT_271332 [Aspergillus homomorphus CBS 101889]